MKLQIIGLGKIGAEIAYTLMLKMAIRPEDNEIVIYEPKDHQMALANFYDLLPVARELGINFTMEITEGVPADAHIICAGVPRKAASLDKSQLYKTNASIVKKVARGINTEAYKKNPVPVFIVTNPPVQLAVDLKQMGISAIPLRACTDELRARGFPSPADPKDFNDFVIEYKGFTQYTPAFACAKEIMKVMDNGQTKV